MKNVNALSSIFCCIVMMFSFTTVSAQWESECELFQTWADSGFSVYATPGEEYTSITVCVDFRNPSNSLYALMGVKMTADSAYFADTHYAVSINHVGILPGEYLNLGCWATQAIPVESCNTYYFARYAWPTETMLGWLYEEWVCGEGWEGGIFGEIFSYTVPCLTTSTPGWSGSDDNLVVGTANLSLLVSVSKPENVEVFDILGKRIAQLSATQTPSTVTLPSNGTYVVKATESGQTMKVVTLH